MLRSISIKYFVTLFMSPFEDQYLVWTFKMRTWISENKRKQYFWLQWCEVGGGDNWNQVPPDLTGDGNLSYRLE